jgi:hypothetical protein
MLFGSYWMQGWMVPRTRPNAVIMERFHELAGNLTAARQPSQLLQSALCPFSDTNISVIDIRGQV